MRLLITGGRAPATLDLIRSLSKRAEHIVLAESAPLSLSSFSRYVKQTVRVPPPRQESQDFIQAIRNIIIAHEITHLIPTCEEIFTVVEDEAWLRRHVLLFAPPHHTLLRLHSKWNFTQWMNELGLLVPKTEHLSSQTQLKEHVQQQGSTHVYKPEWSRFGAKVQISPTKTTWIAKERCDHDYPWLAQAFVDGEQWCSYSWFHRGQLLVHSSYPMSFSKGAQASLVFAHHPHPDIEAWVKQFGAQTGYSGQVAFDFIDNQTGLYAIECNPRLTSGMHTLIELDLGDCLLSPPWQSDTPSAPAQNEVLAHTGSSSTHQREATHFKEKLSHSSREDDTSSTKDQSSQLSLIPREVLYGSASPQALKAALFLYALPEIKDQGLAPWFKALLVSHDVIGRWRDPLPGLCWPLGYLHFAWIAWREGISAVEASTFDIEWNAER